MTNPHPPEEQLLRLSDGELTARDASIVRTHLESCWQCRGRLGELEGGIADFVQYDRRVVAPLLPEPPRPWADLTLRMQEVDRARREPVKMRSVRWALAVAASSLLVFLLVRRFERVPEVNAAAALLQKAAVAEASAPQRPKRIRIKTSRHNITRAASLSTSDGPEELRKLFAEAHYDWNNPLRVEAYREWRNGLAEKHDEVSITRDATGEPVSYLVRTTTSASTLSEAQLTLSAPGLHAVNERLHFQAGEWVEIGEVSDEEAPSVRPPATTAAAPAVVPPNAPADEVQVIAALHTIGADLGEPIEVTRQGSKVIVAAMALRPTRRQQLLAALSGIPGVELRFDQPELMSSRASQPQRTSSSGGVSALQLLLQNRHPDPNALEEFTNLVLDTSEAAMARAYALRGLARRFPPDVEAQLSPSDRNILARIREDHLRALASRVQDLNRQLGPALGIPEQATSPPRQVAAQELFDAMQRVDQLLTAMLAGAENSAAQPGVADLTAALRTLDAQLVGAR